MNISEKEGIKILPCSSFIISTRTGGASEPLGLPLSLCREQGRKRYDGGFSPNLELDGTSVARSPIHDHGQDILARLHKGKGL